MSMATSLSRCNRAQAASIRAPASEIRIWAVFRVAIAIPATLRRSDRSAHIASRAPRAIPITGPEKILFAPHMGGTRNIGPKFSGRADCAPGTRLGGIKGPVVRNEDFVEQD